MNSLLTSRHCPFGPPPVQCGLRYIPETKWQKCLQDICEMKLPSSLQNCLQQELGAALNVPGVKQQLLSIRVLRPPKWQPRMGKPARARQCWLQAAFWNWFFLTWGSAKSGTWYHMPRLGMVFILSFSWNCGAAGPGKAMPWWQW